MIRGGDHVDVDAPGEAEEPQDDRSVQQLVDASVVRVPDDDTPDVLILGELEERTGDVPVFEANHLGPRVFGQAQVILQKSARFGRGPSPTGRLHEHREKVSLAPIRESG